MIVSKGICFESLLLCLIYFHFFLFDMASGKLVLDRRLQPHVPCESASHLACNMLAVLNDGWRDQMPVSTTALQLINHSQSIY